MKTLLSLVVCASLSVALFAQPESKGHISRERALARLTKLFSDSEVVVLARVSQERESVGILLQRNLEGKERISDRRPGH